MTKEARIRMKVGMSKVLREELRTLVDWRSTEFDVWKFYAR
jgi:hypothetical protein